MTVVLLSMALAAPPALRPAAAPWDVQDRWARHQMASGVPRDPLVCRPLVPEHAQVCLRRVEGEGLAWVTKTDLEAWGLASEKAFAALEPGATRALLEADTVPVAGMDASYLRLVSGEGWAAALPLMATQLRERLGPDLRVAIPAGTVALAWRAGDAELDKVMAVGVVELADEQPGEVSRTVFRLDGEVLVPFAEARAAEPPAPDVPAP